MEGQIICRSTNHCQFVEGQIICQTTNSLSKDIFLGSDKGGWVGGGEWGQRLLNHYDYQTEFGLIKSPVFAPTGHLKCIILPKLSHLSVHVVNRLLRENRKSIPKFFHGKKSLKNVTLQI